MNSTFYDVLKLEKKNSNNQIHKVLWSAFFVAWFETLFFLWGYKPSPPPLFIILLKPLTKLYEPRAYYRKFAVYKSIHVRKFFMLVKPNWNYIDCLSLALGQSRTWNENSKFYNLCRNKPRVVCGFMSMLLRFANCLLNLYELYQLKKPPLQ